MAEQGEDKSQSKSLNLTDSGTDSSLQSSRLSRSLESGVSRIQSSAVDISARVKDFNTRDALDAVLDAPVRLRREWQEHGAIGAITRFPLATVILFLMITLYFVSHSGFYDRYLTQFDDDPNKTDLNVNGDLEVYLPDGSKVGELLGLIEDDWTTNVMVIYIELGGGRNITDQRILQEISYVENILNPYLSDDSDDVIYILSLSTVLKEVNSSAPRIREALVTEAGNLGCATGLSLIHI